MGCFSNREGKLSGGFAGVIFFSFEDLFVSGQREVVAAISFRYILFKKHLRNKWEHQWRVLGRQNGFERLQIASLGSRKAVAVVALHVVALSVLRVPGFCKQ